MVPTDDSFISDDEEEYCPLCVEEMDISDKNFRPCPCGYQICQFCYNNIKQNPELNGRCPGCRRFYSDETVEYKSISADEYRLQQLKREKRDREKKQREKEKKETEMANKKHLAGLRVVQKNLVYVTGLNPPCPPEDLHAVLRSDKYFGQYGKISKIVINKKSPAPQTGSAGHHHHQSPGIVVYVTFTRKEDALKCINELDGSLCDGRILRAAHGTTKYCSSYLRGHPCPNPNCMFLHEPGEEADSYTRKDLSTQQGIKMSMMGMNANSRVSSSTNIAGSQHQYSGDENVSLHSEEEQDHNDTSSNPLPATAQWAKAGSASASNSPSVNNNTPLANSAAFPTLGEIFRDQKQQSQVQQRKESGKQVKVKGRKTKKESLPADIDLDDDSTALFIEETTQILKNLEERKEKLNVQFKKLSKTEGRVLPLFAFGNRENFVNDSKPEDGKLLTLDVVEKYLLRPVKNYHLAYANHPIMQQQRQLQQQQQRQLQQQQVQQQQVQQIQQVQQQQTPNLPTAQLQQLQLEHAKKLLETQQQQVQGANRNAQQQQVQQQLLLLQLQQQQQQSQAAVNQLNNIRANERANTSTPPPPGLFASSKPAAPFGQVVGLQNPIPASVNYDNVGAVGNQSSSSQLLTQLMGGKR
ncbi:transcriptional repressor general negative regulator of transcription subunit 4 [Scheffersomyces coipomensis]|uniref:transcriptional repressor general negative regulator of transcription subunit 4 n=1 Tax=Scheffersomyces coipomensis TaxID=1788519 RepID=UPI00315DF375